MEKEIKPARNNLQKNLGGKGEIVIYQSPDKKAKIDVSLDNETVWLSQKQIALLFGTQRPAILAKNA